MSDMDQNSKLTKQEKSWILYDVGNSAFTLMISTLIPIYFNNLAEHAGLSSVSYLATWGYALSVATLISAVLGLIMGALADQKGFKRIMFSLCLFFGVAACFFLGTAGSWTVFLVVFVIARVAYADSLVCYDSMLTDVAVPEHMDRVSAGGYAWGYIGSCIPFLLCLILNLTYEKIGMPFSTVKLLSFLIVAVWWFAMSLPLLKNFRQKHYAQEGGHVVRDSMMRLAKTFSEARSKKHIFVFLIAFFFFIDGVYTIIDMATAYGTALGLNTAGLLLALLVTQFVAFPFAILFGRLAGKYSTGKLILICIAAYTGIALYAIFLKTQLQFWILAICVGMFQGGIQSLARSYYARLIPEEQAGQYFGLFDICGKGASIVGSFLVGAVSQATGSMNLGVGAIAIIMMAGFFLMIAADRLAKEHVHDPESPADRSGEGAAVTG